MLWLVGRLGIEPRLAILQVNHKLIRRAGEASAPEGGGVCGPCPTLHQFLGPGICLTTEENHGKTSVRARKTSVRAQRGLNTTRQHFKNRTKAVL